MGSRAVFLVPPGHPWAERAKRLPADLGVQIVDMTLPDDQKAALCKDAEVLVLGVSEISPDFVRRLPRLKYIQLLSAGFDRMDVHTISEMGIRICNNSASIAPSVADHTIMLMLACLRHLIPSWKSVQHRRWAQELQGLDNRELTGKTIGIVGFGAIGREVARRLRGWDVTVLYHDIVPAPPEVERDLRVRRVPLEDLLRQSDIVTVHVPLNRRTRGMINASFLSLMKPTAILINTSRGEVADEHALLQALRQRRIAGAGLDVLAQEPTPPDNPLLDLDNVVITPHRAGPSVEVWERTLAFLTQNLRRMLNGQEPLSVIRIQD
ncbi:MAG: 2-hydroxyacid dehydrogenase [Dehalococcoidia bacterium]|nr:2-hydroxyacid dehydrogenase [Dehalococcoidia bacterium]MDW8119972.1 2-hydroxyacid dehydrogenase [Chloroflexota bacterium]